MNSNFCLRLHKQLSYNGFKPDVLKSAMQKYLRRKDLTKGIWSLVELDLFELLENDIAISKKQGLKESLKPEIIKMNAKKIRTNMINRLVVIMSEEISINCWWLPIKIKELYENWMSNRNTHESRKYLITMYKILFNANKLRLISDLKTVYNLPPYYLNDYAKLAQLHKKLITMDDKLSKRFQELSENVTRNIEAFEQCIKNKSEDAFYYLEKLIEKEKKSYCCKIWEVLSEYSPNKEVTESLKFFFKKMTHKEKWIYLYHAVLLIIHEKSIDFTTKIDDIIVNDEEVNDYYSKNINNEMMELDNFVFDIHTGSTDPDLKTKFAIEGALISNECKMFFNQDYRKLYIKFKEMIDEYESQPKQNLKKRKIESSASSESSPAKLSNRDELFGYIIKDLSLDDEIKIKSLPQAQKRTANYKKAVYVDKEFVYKGPFDKNDVKFTRNLRNVKAILLFEKFLNFSKNESSVEDWAFLYKNSKDEYYLVSKNVGREVDEYEHEITSTKIEKNVKVIKRGSFVKRISEIEKKEISPEILKSSLQHLYFRFLLNIGDSGTHNILLREDDSKSLVSGIDLEEKNSDLSKCTKISMLFKKVSKLQIKLYSPYLNFIKDFQECFSKDQKDELQKIGCDVSAIDNNINRWLIAK